MVNLSYVKMGGRYGTVDIAFIEQILASEEIDVTKENTISTHNAPEGTTHVRIATDKDIYVAFGTKPDSLTAERLWMPANSVEYFSVTRYDRVAISRA